jgi:hypothetical protein
MAINYEPTPINGKVEAPKPTAPKGLHLVKADIARLKQVWPFVRRGCLTVKAKAGHPGDEGAWTPEHVRAQLELGLVGRSSCELWCIADEAGKLAGFIVTVVSNCPYQQIPISLLVWVAYTQRPIGSKNARQILSELEDYARGLGLRFLDGYTSRPEWAAWLKRHGHGYRTALALIRRDLW